MIPKNLGSPLRHIASGDPFDLGQATLTGSSDLVFLVRGPPGPSASKGVLESSLEDVWKILERIWLLAARAGAALCAVQADQGNLEKNTF